MNTVSPRLSLLAAIDTEGNCWYSLTQAATDSDVLYTFFKSLIGTLDQESSAWQETTVFLLDGARYHTSRSMRQYLRDLGVRVIYSGPYSYEAAPIERLFGAIKLGELNPERVPTGKR